jgi:hypothetical protein
VRDERVVESEDLRRQFELTARLDQLRPKGPPLDLEPGSVWVTIYLSDVNGHEQIETVVEHYVNALGFRLQGSEDPKFRSFSIRKWFKWLGREAAQSALHAADAQLVLGKDAEITATMLQHLAPVLNAIQGHEKVVIRVGAALIVQIGKSLSVLQLTAEQQNRLNHHPALAQSPDEVLPALEAVDELRGWHDLPPGEQTETHGLAGREPPLIQANVEPPDDDADGQQPEAD